jgi:hypothetical protein
MPVAVASPLNTDAFQNYPAHFLPESKQNSMPEYLYDAFISHASEDTVENSQAYGNPFDGLSCAGLLKLVRDLILHYAYRDMIQSPERAA